MKRHKFFAVFLLFSLAALLVVGVGGTAAQDGSNVYVLVVDDFGGHMRELTQVVLNSRAYSDLMAPLVQQADGLSAQVDPASIAPIDFGELGGGDQSQQIPPGLENFPIEAASRIVAQQAPGFNRIFERGRQIEGRVSTENCAVIPEGQGFFSTGGASFFSTGGAGWFSTGGAGMSSAPHGDRVMAQLEELKGIVAPDAPITFIPVDTDGFTTSVIMNNISAAISDITVNDPGANIVINMSFAVIPCTQVGSLAAYDAMMSQFDPQTEEDLAALQAFFAAVVTSGVYEQPLNSGDGLLNFISQSCPEGGAESGGCEISGAGIVIAIAAAGNAGENFPYAPAQWGGIVSVSASDEDALFVSSAALASYSNHGGVMLPGIWNSLANGTTDVGTSFAAPRYSFMMALLLAGIDNDFCGTGSQVLPALPDIWSANPPVSPSVTNDTIC
jgi:hypothetical protein